MKFRRYILLFDAIINLILGVLLLSYTTNLAEFFGVPLISNYFYPNILGGILVGIAIALYIESRKTDTIMTLGLGLTGAISINLCGGFVLLFWLLSGNMEIPLQGKIFLWSLDILLILLSSIELFNHFRLNDKQNSKTQM
jgi:hypothetical protein